MMNINRFLNFNQRCLVCDKELTLYMYTDTPTLWKGEKISKEEYRFRHLLLRDKADYTIDQDIILYTGTTSPSGWEAAHLVRLNSEQLLTDCQKWKLYFFKLCGTDAITDHQVDFDINWYDACYHRTSPWCQLERHPENHRRRQLYLVNPEHADIINRDESFAFKKTLDDRERVYFLNLNTEDDKTKFYHYTTTAEERRNVDFEPKYFEIENLPTVKQRPDFSLSGRDKLIEKFDTWITFS